MNQMRHGRDSLEREEWEKSEGTRNFNLQGSHALRKEMGKLGEKAGFLGKTANLVFYS